MNKSTRSKSLILGTTTLVLALTMLQGCSSRLPPHGALYQRLSNRGPVLLSTDNPYLPANRLLSEELGNSSDLRDFVARRGSPAAIQVTQGMLSRTELSFIYPAENEMYRLAKKQSGWSVGEPEPLSEEALEQIEKELALGGMSIGDTLEAKKYVAAVLPPSYEEDEDSARASLGREHDEGLGGTRRASTTRNSSQNKLPKQAKITLKKGGVLTHTVTFPGESLSVLAAWYTGAASNLQLIAKANKIERTKGLKLGQSVNIPAKLLKNKKPLSQAFLRSALR